MKRTVTGATIIVLLTLVGGCTSGSSSAKLPAGTVLFDCSAPIGELASPTEPQTATLDAVALDTTSTVQVDDSGFPHRLFAKTALIVHAGHDAVVSVPADWASRVSIAWGNHAAMDNQLAHPGMRERSDGHGRLVCVSRRLQP